MISARVIEKCKVVSSPESQLIYQALYQQNKNQNYRLSQLTQKKATDKNLNKYFKHKYTQQPRNRKEFPQSDKGNLQKST